MPIDAKTVNQLMQNAKFRDSYKVLPKGKTFKNLSTILIVPIPLETEEKKFLNCKKCKCKNEYVAHKHTGFNPVFIEGWKNKLIKPMNVPFLEMVVPGREVGDAYNTAIEQILSNPALSEFKYILTLETDNIIPFIPNSPGPLMMLYETMEKGFDVVGGLYWTKGSASAPLIYGDPKSKKGRKDKAGFFKVRHDWEPGDVVECNGMGMGFTLFKLDIFKDKNLRKPWFVTKNEHGEEGPVVFTQDLWFFEDMKKNGYRCAVDTRVALGHMDLNTGIIY